MHLQINGKSLLDCGESDLKEILYNPDFKEGQYIDYKETFAFLEKTGNKRNEKREEFKNDVCSFANADGGYLVYGICEDKGCASRINGVEILNDDTDRFELERRNDLNGIQPKIPTVIFNFIRLLSGKYVVIIYIKHDSFSPYLHIVDEKNYKVYKRYGNGKKIIPYSELRQMFNQSLSLEKSIYEFRKSRVDSYRELGEGFGEKFFHLMFVPETFMDISYRKNVFALEKTGQYHFGNIFSAIGCNTTSIPCVDGLHFITFRENSKAEAYVRNNGIIEACAALNDIDILPVPGYSKGVLSWRSLCDVFEDMLSKYAEIWAGERSFVCLSLVGCKNVVTECKEVRLDHPGVIDRNIVFCEPIEMVRTNVSDNLELIKKKLYISFALAIGVKYDEKLGQLVKEVYGVKP